MTCYFINIVFFVIFYFIMLFNYWFFYFYECTFFGLICFNNFKFGLIFFSNVNKFFSLTIAWKVIFILKLENTNFVYIEVFLCTHEFKMTSNDYVNGINNKKITHTFKTLRYKTKAYYSCVHYLLIVIVIVTFISNVINLIINTET